MPAWCSGGVRVSPGRRSSGYGLLCRPLLPFSQRRGRVLIGANAFAEFSKSKTPPCPQAWFSRSDHIRSIRSGPHRLEGVRVFSGTGGTHRGTVQNPGALRGRLGAGVVAYVPRYGAYVTLSRAPRETALFQVHCCHSSLPGRYASAAYTSVCGGTTGNMPRIPAGGVLRYASVCVGMVHL